MVLKKYFTDLNNLTVPVNRKLFAPNRFATEIVPLYKLNWSLKKKEYAFHQSSRQAFFYFSAGHFFRQTKFLHSPDEFKIFLEVFILNWCNINHNQAGNSLRKPKCNLHCSFSTHAVTKEHDSFQTVVIQKANNIFCHFLITHCFRMRRFAVIPCVGHPDLKVVYN